MGPGPGDGSELGEPEEEKEHPKGKEHGPDDGVHRHDLVLVVAHGLPTVAPDALDDNEHQCAHDDVEEGLPKVDPGDEAVRQAGHEHEAQRPEPEAEPDHAPEKDVRVAATGAANELDVDHHRLRIHNLDLALLRRVVGLLRRISRLLGRVTRLLRRIGLLLRVSLGGIRLLGRVSGWLRRVPGLGRRPWLLLIQRLLLVVVVTDPHRPF